MKKNEDPRSLREVWEWKDKAYQEVKDLDLKSVIKKRLEDAIRTSDLIQVEKQHKAA
jgi:hypothetical protein